MEQCLSEKQAAQMLGVSRITLLRARHRGLVQHFRHGKRVTYSPSQLRAYMTSVERQAVSH